MIPVFCLNWHYQNKSDSVHRALVNPLKPYLHLELVGEYTRSTSHFRKQAMLSDTPVIFFQIIPPAEILLDNLVDVVWIPMWDSMVNFSQKWWDTLPKSLRIVAYSDVVSKMATQAGLRCLIVRYFPNPDQFEVANHEKEKTLMYRNRTGLVNEDCLAQLCETLGIEHLYFRPKTDPQFSHKFYTLPSRVGGAIITSIETNSVDEYQQYVQRATHFIAPRLTEGIGLTFLDAFSAGKVVIAANCASMNEYITHKYSGILLDSNMEHNYLKINHQNWRELKRVDNISIGIHARQSAVEGYNHWHLNLNELAKFILDER